MKDLLVLGGILGISFLLFGQKKTPKKNTSILEDTGIRKF